MRPGGKTDVQLNPSAAILVTRSRVVQRPSSSRASANQRSDRLLGLGPAGGGNRSTALAVNSTQVQRQLIKTGERGWPKAGQNSNHGTYFTVDEAIKALRDRKLLDRFTDEQLRPHLEYHDQQNLRFPNFTKLAKRLDHEMKAMPPSGDLLPITGSTSPPPAGSTSSPTTSSMSDPIVSTGFSGATPSGRSPSASST